VWARWEAGPDDIDAFTPYLADTGLELAAEAESIRERAGTMLDARRDAWRPVAEEILGWLPDARAAAEGRAREADLKTAAKWIRDEANIARTERLRPIVDQARQLWATMRSGSNVSLDDIALSGTRTRRGVDLDVRVDSTEGAALSVMSQGELHTLALALFLPRATLPDSPFRFVLIDDPVQAMDNDKVAGLAKVLDEVARTRQVVVFTHDDRLPTACRQLGVDARVLIDDHPDVLVERTGRAVRDLIGPS
jgi:hypothetical protein